MKGKLFDTQATTSPTNFKDNPFGPIQKYTHSKIGLDKY